VARGALPVDSVLLTMIRLSSHHERRSAYYLPLLAEALMRISAAARGEAMHVPPP